MVLPFLDQLVGGRCGLLHAQEVVCLADKEVDVALGSDLEYLFLRVRAIQAFFNHPC